MRLPSPPIRRHLCACASRLYTPRMPCRNSQFVLRFVPDLALSDESRARPRVVLVFDPGQGAADTSEIVPRHALYWLPLSYISSISRLPLGYILATSRLQLVRSHRQADTTRPRCTSPLHTTRNPLGTSSLDHPFLSFPQDEPLRFVTFATDLLRHGGADAAGGPLLQAAERGPTDVADMANKHRRYGRDLAEI